MTNLELLQAIADASEISDRKNAELQVALQQMAFYVKTKAASGDLYARNLVEQLEQS